MKLRPADKVIKACGGIRPTAREFNITPTSVQQWSKSGDVPLHRIRDAIKICERKGFHYDSDDFLP